MLSKLCKTENHHHDMANEESSIDTSIKPIASIPDPIAIPLDENPKDREMVNRPNDHILEPSRSRAQNSKIAANDLGNVHGDGVDYDHDDDREEENGNENENEGQGEEDEGHDTDPPAHYPRAGNGLARILGPESEDLEWLVDDSTDVFCHVVYPVAGDDAAAAAAAAAAPSQDTTITQPVGDTTTVTFSAAATDLSGRVDG